MKKSIVGVLSNAYYNACEAGRPLGVTVDGKEYAVATNCDVLCDLVKKVLDLPWDIDDTHKLIGKKVKITIEV